MDNRLPKSCKVVAIGGGHGLGQVLKALSYLENNLTALVTTTDNGGSSGKIRNVSPTIAWGDIRNCIESLADLNSVQSNLFSYRFPGETGFGGHALGNLLLHHLSQSITPLGAIEYFKHQLNIKANILPMLTTENDLLAIYPDGKSTVGELQIDSNPMIPTALSLIKPATGLTEVMDKIASADLIIFAPGSFFTSVVPSLLIESYSKAISNSKARLVFINNLTVENSSAAYLTFYQKKQYIEGFLNYRKIDYLIENASVFYKSDNIIRRPLIDVETGLHCPDSLRFALSDISLSEKHVA
ncbi:gluconeogenesis factor YvcK family protein [Parashewanella tropica]|uniref:gluconeogenesis factor YvcK family protein n=1 Tax=Parashewanella tropica TaxID=2547970 RepID=UPI0010593703|nr:uridine diphosphate-N-acetylglucosamine-binding protein YvcK [Parashewanella tropica]